MTWHQTALAPRRVITAVPVVALFIYAQKYIVSGLFAGSVK